MNESKYKEIDFNQIKYCFNGELVLLVTATDLETNATHQKIKPLSGYDRILKTFKGDLTYYLGQLGNYNIVHVQCSMGSLGRDSSIMTVSTALNATKSKIVIMVGVAFGVDDSKQKVGDVLISESIIPYNTKRIGITETIQRGIEAPSSKTLVNRFKNIKTSWEYILPDGEKAKLIPTRLLSGEELVDNIDRRNELIKQNLDSTGGEMEGVGIYAACDGKADWIVVKGICDFADGEKGKEKTFKQTVAINSALSACLELFNSSYAFKKLKIFPVTHQNGGSFAKIESIHNVLFDIYDISKEPYYIERNEDDKFNLIIKQIGIWIFGPVGCGKSNLIFRNLIKGKKNFIQISLASCIGTDIENFFREIVLEVASKTEGLGSIIQPKTFSESIKVLFDLLSKYYENKEVIIFIEEIPIGSESDYKEFSERIFALLISKNLVTGLEKVRFVLSSINSPTNHIQVFQHKIHQQLNFMQLNFWNQEETISLIEIIENEIQFRLPGNIKEKLISISNGSPRFIKKFFRSVCTINKRDENTLNFLLTETKRELSQFKNV